MGEIMSNLRFPKPEEQPPFRLFLALNERVSQ
jgi:hypothetical protein